MNDDYSTEAHSKAFHGKSGEAVGKKEDLGPMEYSQKTHAEGAESQPVAGHEGLSGGKVGLADHHANHGGDPHKFKPPAAGNAHGYGHPESCRSGAERTSGHSGAHRIGGKKK